MKGAEIVSLVGEAQDLSTFRDLHWEGSFEEYLDLVAANPRIARSAFQRVYDMIVSHGSHTYVDGKKRITHYKFFDDVPGGGRDAVFGLEIPLMRLVNVFKSAARRYGTERRIILLHGPVGSSKSTIVRLMKRGMEEYSRRPEGALYTYTWKLEGPDGPRQMPCPMHEEPLRLIPQEVRDEVIGRLNQGLPEEELISVDGELCPACRHTYREMLEEVGGDWTRVIQRVRVRRLVLSEKDRIGIGTFQPKDEKNQDSTELTGDINYRKIAEYGSDSDPRAFNFDGEFNIANRGLVEFIEVLKLDVAFLYDLLGASQEHRIKPKKFAQTDIDEVIIGHSVGGATPIPFRLNGTPGWTTMEALYERYSESASRLEVLAWDFEQGAARWTPVRSLFRHRFTGDLLTTSQKWGVVETTPNHSIYGRDGETFFPNDRHELLAVRDLGALFSGPAGATIDLAEGIEEFARAEVGAGTGAVAGARGGRAGAVSAAARGGAGSAPVVRTQYDPAIDPQAVEDLVTAFARYAATGAIDRAPIDRLTSGGPEALLDVIRRHAGHHPARRRLPDFLFRLPERHLRRAFDELTAARKGREFETASPVLAAQAGTLATLVGRAYTVYAEPDEGTPSSFRLRFADAARAGRAAASRTERRTMFEARLAGREVTDEWVYDVECAGLHNFICGIGNVVAHNTNEPEYRKLQSNEFMEALRDRTVKIDIPYITRLTEEIKIYGKDFNPSRIRGKHIAPHTIEMAAMWAVLTRLEQPKRADLTLIQKLKLYNGQSLPGFTEDSVREVRKAASREAMEGISPRYIQDKISNTLVADRDEGCINPFMVLNELESGLRHHSLITNEEMRRRFTELLTVVREEYENTVKNEVQRAISADEEAIARLAANYIDNIKAYTLGEKVRNRYTGRDEEPDERLMRSIEEKIDIPEGRKDDFRREIMNYIGAQAVEGKVFNYRSNARLQKALELKLFEDQKDSIKLSSLVSSVVDRDTQEKIDVVKGRLIANYGYCDVCATDVLTFVASIFARGDVAR